MGQGQEEVKTTDHSHVEIQERGEIYFFYRPKVDKEEAHSADDVQRLYIVLRPESGERPLELKQDPSSGKEGSTTNTQTKTGSSSTTTSTSTSEGGHGCQEVNIEKQPLLRLVVMGKKSLPDPGKKSRPYWGFVEMVTTKIEDVKNALEGEDYETGTKGKRHNPPAKAVGEGIYRILRHGPSENPKKTHTHLVYKLEFPEEDKSKEPQECLNIEREGSFHIQIKKPDTNLEKKRKAVFPAQLHGQFGQRRYCPADPPDFLNYEGCEFLLISASDDIQEELGLELKTETSCSDLVNTFGETASTTPLLKGTWV